MANSLSPRSLFLLNLSLFSLSMTFNLRSFQSGLFCISNIIVLSSVCSVVSDIFLRRVASLVLAAWKAMATDG